MNTSQPNDDFVCLHCNILTFISGECQKCSQGVCDPCLKDHPLTGCRECGVHYCNSCFRDEDTYLCNICDWIYHKECKTMEVCHICYFFTCQLCGYGEGDNFTCSKCAKNKGKLTEIFSP